MAGIDVVDVPRRVVRVPVGDSPEKRLLTLVTVMNALRRTVRNAPETRSFSVAVPGGCGVNLLPTHERSCTFTSKNAAV